MANNYFDMTGTLTLDKVTPVIQALFGPFELDANYPGNGEAYIACISESSNCSWDAVLDNLRELVQALGLTLPDEAADNVQEHLCVLAKHFGADGNVDLANLIDHSTFDEDADLDALFTIARALDDGHGLKSYQRETSWHCSKPRLGEFGGEGTFAGIEFSISSASHQTTAFGDQVELALVAKDLEKATAAIHQNLETILAGIHDEATRKSVRLQLSTYLALSI